MIYIYIFIYQLNVFEWVNIGVGVYCNHYKKHRYENIVSFVKHKNNIMGMAFKRDLISF